MEDQPHGTRRKQSHFRPLHSFSLRTLLILTTLIAACLAWWSHKARRQREAVGALEKAGATVRYDFHGQYRLEKRPPRWPGWLVDLLGVDYFANVVGVNRPDKATEADLALLANLPSLTSLDLSYSHITDDGLVHLKGLHSLEGLSLYRTRVTGTGFTHLQRLASLETLELSYAPVTDEGVGHLAKLHQLKNLILAGTNTADAGLQHLTNLTDLVWQSAAPRLPMRASGICGR